MRDHERSFELLLKQSLKRPLKKSLKQRCFYFLFDFSQDFTFLQDEKLITLRKLKKNICVVLHILSWPVIYGSINNGQGTHFLLLFKNQFVPTYIQM